ncbi:TetR/AcrR family transcriptional regulator [Tropicibacter sp. Alg240-R139]|uniref:TetR/AcrR family transcriptional regulator n=1 Tax=Tropicibacter sp. Alg240-R139 TaxID=2305991 RepID=UPI0013DE7D20|nr:TetR/AcrR family transcriptional regulator [Tropicibacter sp. Alg240-R139]
MERDCDGELLLITSTVSTLATPSGESLVAKSTRLSTQGADQQVCRVILSQLTEGSSEKRNVAEALCVFQVKKLALGDQSVVADKAEKAAGAGKESPSSTAEMRRLQIFEGACKVIARHGFGNSTMREIAREAGLSVPLMYKYIKDKDDILYLIMTVNMQGMFTFFDSQEFSSGNADENLISAVDTYIDYIGENRKYINLVYSETRSLSAENRMKVFDTERDFMRRWQAIIDDGVDKGVFRPVNTELLSNFIYFLCTVWALRHWSIGHFPVAEVKTALHEFVLTGLMKVES